MRTRAERRELRLRKIKQREEVIENGGYKAGLMYDRHVNKIKKNGTGYMSKHGTLLHYALGTSHSLGKVRDRNSYNGTNNWKASDTRKINSMIDQLKEEQ